MRPSYIKGKFFNHMHILKVKLEKFVFAFYVGCKWPTSFVRNFSRDFWPIWTKKQTSLMTLGLNVIKFVYLFVTELWLTGSNQEN